MRSAPLRLGALLAAAALATACTNDTTAPTDAAPQNNGISARGGSSSGGGRTSTGGGTKVSTGNTYTGIVDSARIVNVGVYYPSYQDVWYSGSHAFVGSTTIKIRSSSDVPLMAGACAQFTYVPSAGIESTSDIKVLSADRCGI